MNPLSLSFRHSIVCAALSALVATSETSLSIYTQSKNLTLLTLDRKPRVCILWEALCTAMVWNWCFFLRKNLFQKPWIVDTCSLAIKKGPIQFVLKSLDRYISHCSNQQSSKLTTNKLIFPILLPFSSAFSTNWSNSNLICLLTQYLTLYPCKHWKKSIFKLLLPKVTQWQHSREASCIAVFNKSVITKAFLELAE